MINFSLTLLGKNPSDLVYQDIVKYFETERTESDYIEFKSFPSKNNSFDDSLKGVIKAICALLNSNGGIVIWGAPVGVKDSQTHKKKFQGPLTPLSEHKEKDWVVNKVSDNLIPLPIGIRIQVLQNSPTENLYIFEIQESPYKPHQFENVYYVRLDAQTKPAPHYLVEALFRRISYPNIKGYLKFNKASIVKNPLQYIEKFYYQIDLEIILFNFSELQNEENIIYRLTTFPGKFISKTGTSDPGFYTGKEELLHFGTNMVNNQTILFTEEEMSKNDYKVTILFTHGGRKSPAKVSEYHLNFNKIDIKNPYNTTLLIDSMSENQLFSEVKERLGTTRESTLKAILGRVPNEK